MASGARTLGALVLGLALVPLGAVAFHAGGLRLSPSDWRALEFTLLQSGLSALLSVLLALPLARALARRRFWGRGALITLMGAPFLLPVIVAVLGLLAVFGRAGVLNAALAGVGLPPISIYGLQGVLIAHLFLNLPLAVRMILQGWQSIPEERFRLAESLSFTPRDLWRHIERPMLASVLPGALATIFAICLSSFAIALTLGGGPQATTLELAIYQALRFEFDLRHAAALALVQTGLGGASALLAWGLTKEAGFGAGLDRSLGLRAPDGWRRALDAIVLLIGGSFILAPLLALLIKGLPGIFTLPASVWPAAGRSVVVALISTLVTIPLALGLAWAVAKGAGRWLELAAVLPLALSGLVLGTGLFLLVQPFVLPSDLALPVTILVNMLMALPFAFRLILPEARVLAADYGRLAASLNLTGFTALRLMILPRLARPLGFAAGLVAALSMGDLGVIALFADQQGATLPLLIQHLTGAYRSAAAASASLLLVALSFALFWAFDRGGRHVKA